ncbi:MAG: hypothetical protein ACFFE8_09680 [Candidatus Heimdallarchaeota archaeon]
MKTSRLLRHQDRISYFGLVVMGIILVLALEILISATALKRSSWNFIIGFFVPFSVYCVIAVVIHRYQDFLVKKRYFTAILMIVASIIQIRLLFTDVTLSDDIYRFFMEGMAFVNGINPYSIPPSDFPSSLQPPFQFLVNNPDVTSPYPPFALLVFAVLYMASLVASPVVFRVFFSFMYLATIPLMAHLLSVFDKPSWRIILYAWNPLLHLETGNGSHFDPLVVFLVMAAIFALSRENQSLGGAALLMATLLKYYPIFLIGVYWRQLGRKGRIIVLSGLFLYSLSIILTPSIISGLLIYADRWYFNASLMWVLVESTGTFFGAKIVVGVIFLSIYLLIILKSEHSPHILNPVNGFFVLASFLLLQPVFHPWYLFWIFPFVLLVEPLDYSWILLTGTIILSYHVYISFDAIGVWYESNIVRIIEFLPFYAGIIYVYREKLKRTYRTLSKPQGA